MICEMCGREAGRLTRVAIEGSVIGVCPECSRFGDEVVSGTSGGVLGPGSTIRERLGLRERRYQSKDIYEQFKMELSDDYPKLIQEGRRKLGMTVEDLGKKLNEKKSVISKLEHGELRPDNKLIQKIEKALNIHLREAVEEVHVQKRAISDRLTLGDFVKKE